jgi:hypothetical protein
MKVIHTKTTDGRPLTIALYDGMAARLPGLLGPDAVQRQLNIYRALDAQQKKAEPA